MYTERTAYNEAKIEILDIIRTLGEATAMQISLFTNKTPECCSMNLLRYHRMGLLHRYTLEGRTKIYSLSERGEERLEWFELANAEF